MGVSVETRRPVDSIKKVDAGSAWGGYSRDGAIGGGSGESGSRGEIGFVQDWV